MENIWHPLITRIQFINTRYGINPNRYIIPTQEVISEFEREHNIIFPTDYKEFCKVFGLGFIDNWLKIYCPGTPLLVETQEYLSVNAEWIRKVNNYTNFGDADARMIDLLEHGFVFAEDLGSKIAFWDLRTYQSTDDSYDIYWAVWDCPDPETSPSDLMYLGRSFFRFINEYCYGIRKNELYPDSDSWCINYTYERV
jgi:SMI1-KNR4 cell-wall